uniref:CHHC U11-48K-type domain-containing protein n=1 Tax=Ficedula albicollis TaxID=59894 RepID=U3JYT7_FICAL
MEKRFDLLDPERLIQCPLVKHHVIRARRFPYHLVKCKESNPEIAKKLATCPFNARHLVPQEDLSEHIMKCNDKAFVEQDVGKRPLCTLGTEPPQEQLNDGSKWQAPPCAEDWETGEELPHLLPSSWPRPPAPLGTVRGQGCLAGHFACTCSYEHGSLHSSGLA